MKVSNKKKNDRSKFKNSERKCPNCGKSNSNGGHFVPALNIWICVKQGLTE